MAGSEALADRIATAYVAVHLLHAARTPGREVVHVAGLPIAVLGVDQPWGTTVLALEGRPDERALAEALAWCAERSVAYSVLVRARDEQVVAALPVREPLPALALDLGAPPAVPQVPGVAAGEAANAEEFRSVYGPAFLMPDGMAEALVGDADIGTPGLVHLVAREGGLAVGCALLRLAEGVGYISAIGTLPGRQGRGIGTFLTRRAAAEARTRGADLALLHAAEGRTEFYEGMGFEVADIHVSRGIAG